eukprot:COSAG01_NODE_24778_length_766_cov_10.535232_1_plen_128_part_01
MFGRRGTTSRLEDEALLADVAAAKAELAQLAEEEERELAAEEEEARARREQISTLMGSLEQAESERKLRTDYEVSITMGAGGRPTTAELLLTLRGAEGASDATNLRTSGLWAEGTKVRCPPPPPPPPR